MDFRPGASLALAFALGLLRAILLAADGAVTRVPLVRARELAEGAAATGAGRTLLTLKIERVRRLSLVSFASELLLLSTALTAALAPNEETYARPLLSALSGFLAALAAIGLELFARGLAQSRPERFGLAWSPLLWLALGVLRPVWALLAGLTARLVRPLGGVSPERAEPMPSLEEVEAHLSAEAAQGRVGQADPQLLRSLLDFSDKTAREVMIPRTQVVAVDIRSPVAEVVRVISEEGHSRLPVYRDTLDELIGILHARDLVPLLALPELVKLQELLRPVFFVPWSKRIGAVLREMQRRRAHLAAVVDEYGGVMGLITLEDILAEIVGEFGGGGSAGSADEEGPEVERLPDGTALVRAGIAREDFATAFGVELPGDDWETLAGWLNQRAGAIPELGERFLIDGLVVQVVERSPSRVRRVRVSQRKPKPEGGPPPVKTVRG